MAALIKKRVLAEFNQSQAIVNEPPIKRLKTLRLLSTSGAKNGTDSSSALAYIECLEKCKSGNDALQLLVRISDAIVYIAPEDVPIAIKKLAERFVVENEIAVRAKIFWVFAELGEVTPDTLEKAKIVNETAELLRNEESHRVKSQGLATLLKLGDYQRALVLKIAQEHLPDTWHGVQTRCLSIIGRYLTANTADDILTLIGNYARSQDPRVRAQAFETMAELHSHRGCRLPASFFKEACAALGDDYEIVRRAVLKLIYLLGREYPENIVVGSDGEDVRMVDCAFSQICSLMGDLSPRVRASAMSLLGTMKSVSRRYIEQALDKKQKVVEADRPEVEEKSGSCGAFIHGLEDEFLEVRTAAVEALCTLSLEQPSIARISLDFMVDMFNDEIQDVRLRAIESLKKMSSSVTLQEDQLETILGALEDFSGEDRESIRSCLAELGASHPYLTLPLVPQLLGRHPFFDTPEPDVDEPSYASVLVLIFNAALHCPSMHALFTEHASKHYHYLRDTMPHLVPRLRPALTSSGIKMEDMDNEENRDKRGREFLEKMGIGIENARPGGRVHTQLLETAAIDLDRMAEMDHHMEGAARFTALYIRCLLLLKSVLKECSVSSTTSISANPVPNTNNNIFVLLQHTQKLQRLFSGLDENDIILANDMWLKALAIELVRVTKSATGSALPLARYFLSEADALPQDTSRLPPFSRALVLQIPTLADVKPGSLTRLLLPMLLTPVVQGEERLPRPSATTRFCRAHIEEPRGDADAALKFTGGLLLGIPLNAKILNLRDPSTLRIKLRHPDQQVQLLLPRQSDLRMQQSNQKDYRLRTTVLLSHQVWMEPCNVEISLALLLPSSSICTHPPLDDPCVIDLCKPIKVSIAPKAFKRGI
ncbi:PREDICTED: integrator complex subunit 4 isoform X2 [Trachymyrmex cornetzi]|uniref:integrator complex subunit 4 isoform X2 n=1 Tax=Trachymyrmex cornetzi TaxID=471704 RepID=UPI00084F0C38|nr:PREDICTED: integrator complex subunit 4 isoform X2 [Trachymyrmex cornetzi]